MRSTSRPQNHPSLLSLPRELRDQITTYSLTSTWNPNSTLRIIPHPDPLTAETHYWPEKTKWQPSPLLLTSHQLRHETLDLISSHAESKSLNFEIAILVKGFVYTPTWTRLHFGLQPQSTLNELKVNLTIFSTEAFRRNDSWPRQPGQVFRSLLAFLNRFIFHGPSFLDENPSFKTPGPHFIETLWIHVAFEDWYTPATWASTVYEIFRLLKALSLLDTVYEYIGKIRVSTKYTYRGEEIERDRTWKVAQSDEAMFREEEWARRGFHFGRTWEINRAELLREKHVESQRMRETDER